jgi:6-phosphogluconate dehydrogenase
MARASADYRYEINPVDVASVWRAGCIIRADLLDVIRSAFEHAPAGANLMVDPRFANALDERQDRWRMFVGIATTAGIPVPAMSASLAYFDAYRSALLPANLTQAQRDFFGAHTYRGIDRDGVFHTDWSTTVLS